MFSKNNYNRKGGEGQVTQPYIEYLT